MTSHTKPNPAHFPGPAAEIIDLVISVAVLNPYNGGCYRYELANGRKVDYWPTTGTFMEVGTAGGFRRSRDKLPSFVRILASQPPKKDKAIGDARRLSSEELIKALRQAYPLLPGLHPKGFAERSLIHEACDRLRYSETGEWPELLLTEVYHPQSDYIYS